MTIDIIAPWQRACGYIVPRLSKNQSKSIRSKEFHLSNIPRLFVEFLVLEFRNINFFFFFDIDILHRYLWFIKIKESRYGIKDFCSWLIFKMNRSSFERSSFINIWLFEGYILRVSELKFSTERHGKQDLIRSYIFN